MRALFHHAERETWDAIAHCVFDIETVRRTFVEPKLQEYLESALEGLDQKGVG